MSSPALPFVFERAVNLKADSRKVFDFHLHPENLAQINPPGIRLLSLEAPKTIQTGSNLRLKVSSYGLPQTWEVVIREVCDFSGQPAKASILDEAVRGPFPFWRHWHEFWQAPDGSTGLADRVAFLPPGGPAGVLLVPLIRMMLQKMFEARHAATKRIFEGR